MTTPDGPADRRNLRVSDADREHAAEVLRRAAGDGRITFDELDERLTAAYGAKTYGELAAVTEDLPEAGPQPPAPVTAPMPPVDSLMPNRPVKGPMRRANCTVKRKASVVVVVTVR